MKKSNAIYLVILVVACSVTITTVLADTVTVNTYPYTIPSSGSSNPGLSVASNGNVGIGTVNPTQNLEVAGNAQIDQESLLGRQNLASLQSYPTGTDDAILNFYQAQNFPGTNAFYRSLDIVSGSANTASIIRFLTEPIGSSSTPTEAMRIDSTGYVGIGTTNPTARLVVNGTVSRSVLLGDPGCGNGFAGIGFTGFTTCTNYAMIGDGGSTYINRPSGGIIAFREANSDELRIASGGNVGIGTTTPAQKLDVNGNIRLTGNIVSPNDICIGTC